MARPVIALLTDFGTRDHYAGTMKGVVLGICPDATLVDISHDVAAHDVLGRRARARRGLSVFSARHDLPRRRRSRRRIARRGIARRGRRLPVRGAGQRRADRRPRRASARKRVVELTERNCARPTVSRTFEGPRSLRARRARGSPRASTSTALGRPAGADPAPRDSAAGASRPDAIDGEVAARRSLRQPDHQHPTARRSRRWPAAALDIRAGRIRCARVVSTYADAPPGEICALFGSTDHLEVAANGASAAAMLDLDAARRAVARRADTIRRCHDDNENRRAAERVFLRVQRIPRVVVFEMP